MNKAEEFLKGLNEHSKIFEVSLQYEYTEEQLILFAAMYHKNQVKKLNLASVSKCDCSVYQGTAEDGTCYECRKELNPRFNVC